MCLVAVAWRARADWPLLVAANRDEFHARPAAPLAWWPEGFAAGRDLEAGGTWMGADRGGRFAAVTNHRDPRDRSGGARSRGELVAGFLAGTDDAGAWVARVAAAGGEYRGFHLLVADPDALWYVSNRSDGARRLAPGVHVVSNAAPEAGWPKVRAIRGRVVAALAQADVRAPLEAALADRTRAPDGALPDTGVPLDWERRLSAAFIVSPDYGTRCSSVLGLAPRRGWMTEQRFDPAGGRAGVTRLDW
jgi:uncharacterized protein with NRDE domain